MSMDPLDDFTGTPDEKVMAEAKARFTRCEDWEALARVNYQKDMKFGNGDSYNQYQWDASNVTNRELERKPCLTINKTQVHCNQIVNDARQNKVGIEVRPTGGAATVDASEVIEGMVRHVEYISKAQAAYDTATYNQVYGGWGYVRVLVDYVDENSFDQDIKIQRIPNPLTIYLDPDIQQYDGSDAKFGFVFKDTPRSEVAAKYPEIEEFAAPPFGNDDSWNTKAHVRECEYFRVGEKTDELILLPDELCQQIGAPSGTTIRKSELPKELKALIPKDARRRKVSEPEVEWFLIIGDQIVDRKPWPGKYIPISRCIGQETIIDGVMDRKGHVRCLLDPQKMYNYQASGSVEFVALQTKTPWLTPVRAIEGYEEYWRTANTENHSYLPYNDMDEDGRPIQQPHRVEPPAAAQGHLNGMQAAESQMMLASGQYQAVMGAPSNETSGKAINARQRQGDNATYHFIDHLAQCVAHVGRIVLDLIPKVYDTPRVIKILGADQQQMSVQIDPSAPQAHAKNDGSNPLLPKDITAVFNPAIGQYDVMADVGPSYETSRQEAFNAFSQIMSSNPEAFDKLGDLYFGSADFPGAEAAAERMKKNLPPNLQDDGPNPEVQQLKQHMEQGAQQALAHIDGLQKQISDLTTQLAAKTEDSDTKKYAAITDRIKVLGAIDPAVVKPFLRAEATETMGHPIMDVAAAHAAVDQSMAGGGMGMQPPGPPGASPMPPAPPMPQQQGAPMNG